MDAKNLLLAALVDHRNCLSAFWYTTVRGRRQARRPAAPDVTPTPLMIAIGFVTNFFDTLGIGSYATTTSMFKAWNVVRDEKIPGHAERRPRDGDRSCRRSSTSRSSKSSS